MGVVGTILMVVFIIVCLLSILLVVIQNDSDGGMGGVFGGGQSAAFGARSASVLTKTTAVLVALFLVIAFALALLNKAPSSDSNLIQTAAEVEGASETSVPSAGSWLDQE